MESFLQHSTNQSFGKLTQINEAKLKAEDYEAAIVMGFHEITGKKLDIEGSGIGQKTFDVIDSNPSAKEAGVKIAKAIQSHFKLSSNVKAEQYGRAKSKLTKFWKSHGATDTTPKTDILIGDKRLSLKIGVAQLMSGGKAESLATFYAAVEEVGEDIKKDKNYKLTEDVINSFVTSTVAPGQLRPIIKSGENEIVNQAEKAHKKAMTVLGNLFENNRDFKIAFAREAMSGFYKYGKDSNSAAEFMVVASADGSSVSIHSVYDDDYCAKIADKSKLQVRFKTSSRKAQGQKTGEYNFWSVTSLIVNAMSESTEHESSYLNIQEVRLLQKAKTFVKNFTSKIYTKIKKTAKSFINFIVGEEKPDVEVSRKIDFK